MRTTYTPERITSERTSLGLSRSKLAELINRDERTMGRFESGEDIPDADEVALIADALGTKVGVFYRREAGEYATAAQAERDRDADRFERKENSISGRILAALRVESPQSNGELAQEVEASPEAVRQSCRRLLLRHAVRKEGRLWHHVD